MIFIIRGPQAAKPAARTQKRKAAGVCLWVRRSCPGHPQEQQTNHPAPLPACWLSKQSTFSKVHHHEYDATIRHTLAEASQRCESSINSSHDIRLDLIGRSIFSCLITHFPSIARITPTTFSSISTITGFPGIVSSGVNIHESITAKIPIDDQKNAVVVHHLTYLHHMRPKMATKLPRICITLSPETDKVLTEISRISNIPKATFITNILETSKPSLEATLSTLKNINITNTIDLAICGSHAAAKVNEKTIDLFNELKKLAEK
ncbi:MAG: hypothetical protein HQK81_15180 [Desulfovibrionaceae bacterium]|nr:hypothetical protein [Desulfovibrionaceae bacterium]